MNQRTAQPQQPIQPQFQFEEDTISFMDILLVLAQHLKLIIIVSSIFCIGTLFYAQFYTSPVYIATATFMSSGGGGQSQMMGLASQFGFSTMPNSETAQDRKSVV